MGVSSHSRLTANDPKLPFVQGSNRPEVDVDKRPLPTQAV